MYELLTGVSPFHADTLQRTTAAVLTSTTHPLPEFEAAIPKALVRIVETCLKKSSISSGDHFMAGKPVRQFSTGASYSRLGSQFDTDGRGRFVVLSEVRKPTPTVVIGWRPELR